MISSFLNEKKIIKKFEKIKLINRNKKYIKVKNNENKFCSIAEIIVQNDINYIPKISVIIPSYNNELYLKYCIETVINQTLKEIEIIFVDDDSTDNSLDLLLKFAQKDRRITIIKQEKMKSCDPRNAGLSLAKGKYLSILDPHYLLQVNMLEEMYKKILDQECDIIICQINSIDFESGKLDENILENSLRNDLIPNKETFSVFDIPNNIFQISQGFISNKLLKTDFIISNNIKFQDNSFDFQFTYTALCLAKKITTIKKSLINKRKDNKILSDFNMKTPHHFLLSFDKIIFNLQRKNLFKLVKESFWKWALSLCIIQLKTLDINSKQDLYNILHKKLQFWNYIDKSLPSSNLYRAIHYIKIQKFFPIINIAYSTNSSSFNRCLISILSLLKNSVFEHINIILLYNEISQKDINKIIELKSIRSFTLQTLFIGDYQYKKDHITKSIIGKPQYLTILADRFSNIDKILYLDSNLVIRKSLLPLWEIKMNNKLILTFEEISNSKDISLIENEKDNLFNNKGIFLINTKEWRKRKFNSDIEYDIKNSHINKANIHIEKIILNTELNDKKFSWNRIIMQHDYNYLKLYNVTDPTIVHFNENRNDNNDISKKSFINEFIKYKNIANNLNKVSFTIPIVLSSDEHYAPYLYTSMISILENSNKKTFYEFYILVPANFSKNIEERIQKINDNYKCSINFIYIKNAFKNYIQKIPHITIPTYYRLLIGNLLPREISKCIYLDTDICVMKDLSELYSIDLNHNYIAGVISPGYYFSEKRNCKRLKLPTMKNYVNAGVLVMNLEKIRRDKMTQKFINLAKRNYDSQDQDVLNVACFGKIITLPPKYNALVQRLEENHPLLRNLFTEQEIFEAKKTPYIIHYADKKKPWNSIGLYMETYWWNTVKKIPNIKYLFNRDNIYKRELKKWWLSTKKENLNIDDPKTFNEKIQWLKLYDSTPKKTYLTDKYLVRRFVKEKIGSEYLIPLLGTYDKFEEINFDNLPNQFMVKCNHGDGYNIIVKDKSRLKLKKIKAKINRWMNENFAFKNGLELQYKDIQPKIMIEEYIGYGIERMENFKFHCFNGIPKFLWIDNNGQNIQKQNLYELKMNRKINELQLKFLGENNLKLIDKMIELSSLLGEGFAYSRINFYIINGKIYFGKITFTSSIDIKVLKRFEKKFDSFLKLPKLAYNIDISEYYKSINPISLYPYNMISIILIIKFIYIAKKYFKKYCFYKMKLFKYN